MKLTYELFKLAVVVIFCLGVLHLVLGCATPPPPDSDEAAYIRHKRGVDLMNYENCGRVIAMIHYDHIHAKHIKTPAIIIRMDLAHNHCRWVLKDFWIPYMDEYLIEAEQ